MSATAYTQYARELRLLVGDACRGVWEPIGEDVAAALDGQASARLRELVPRQTRREHGAFFTSGGVRESFTALLAAPTPRSTTVWWDPACGGGDLLLAAASQLPLASTPQRTLVRWSRLLRGTDLHESFTEVARARLVLAALQRHRWRGDATTLNAAHPSRAFPAVRAGDGLTALAGAYGFAGHLLLNPPFAHVNVGSDHPWTSGRTSSAAIFAAAAARHLSSPGTLTAILPDVLRSGSRYDAWRTLMQSQLQLTAIDPVGLFDQHTDVDVFLLAGRRNSRSRPDTAAWWPHTTSAATVADYFDIRVGPVVDNRDARQGPQHPFLTARDLPASGHTGVPTRRRPFTGRVLRPPFVALRRTSRPGQGPGGTSRGMGVMVTGTEPVAVDNHLITAAPLDGTTSRCVQLLDTLAQPTTAAWLDERIRCRHLTVRVVGSIPWDAQQ